MYLSPSALPENKVIMLTCIYWQKVPGVYVRLVFSVLDECCGKLESASEQSRPKSTRLRLVQGHMHVCGLFLCFDHGKGESILSSLGG